MEDAENEEWSIHPSSTDEADLVREEEEDRGNIELSKEHEYTDKMEEEEMHLHEQHEEDGEKMEDYADKLEEEEEEVLVDSVSDEQAQEDRQPAVMKWLKKPAMANLLAEEISDQQVYPVYSSFNVCWETLDHFCVLLVRGTDSSSWSVSRP